MRPLEESWSRNLVGLLIVCVSLMHWHPVFADDPEACADVAPLKIVATGGPYRVPDGAAGAESATFAPDATEVKVKTLSGREQVLIKKDLAGALGALSKQEQTSAVTWHWPDDSDHADCTAAVAVEAIVAGTTPAAGTVPSGPSATSEPAKITKPTATAGCFKAVDAYVQLIKDKQSVKGRRFALVAFCGDEATIVRYEPPARASIAVGDEIYAAAFVNGDFEGAHFDWNPCSLKKAEGNRFGDLITPATLPSRQTTPYAMYPKLPTEMRRCYDTKVTVKLLAKKVAEGGADVEIDRAYELAQYDRYNYSVQIGVVRSERVDHDFVVTPGDDNVARIRDTGPSGKGPNYVAVLTLYGILHHLYDARCMWQKNCAVYDGRDLVNEHGFVERFSGVVGVGLDSPKKEFLAGLSFEIVPSVNLLGTWRWARVTELDGVKAGDAFSGGADAIPRHDVWHNEFVLGLSLDLSYATALFTRGN